MQLVDSLSYKTMCLFITAWLKQLFHCELAQPSTNNDSGLCAASQNAMAIEAYSANETAPFHSGPIGTSRAKAVISSNIHLIEGPRTHGAKSKCSIRLDCHPLMLGWRDESRCKLPASHRQPPAPSENPQLNQRRFALLFWHAI
jgi:hypothetical protein